jgi:hypothetical protein
VLLASAAPDLRSMNPVRPFSRWLPELRALPTAPRVRPDACHIGRLLQYDGVPRAISHFSQYRRPHLGKGCIVP